MKINYKLITLIALTSSLLIITIFKIEEKSLAKKYLVLDKKIFLAYKNCLIDENCENQTTIKYLKEKEYLDKVIEPKTTEELDGDICIEFKNKQIKYCDDK